MSAAGLFLWIFSEDPNLINAPLVCPVKKTVSVLVPGFKAALQLSVLVMGLQAFLPVGMECQVLAPEEHVLIICINFFLPWRIPFNPFAMKDAMLPVLHVFIVSVALPVVFLTILSAKLE